MHLAPMITDLAVMLLTAGFITILFKKIKQPLIIGYILVGFLISPYFPMFFTASDTESISLWSEIGVIILMFHIGLEFNLHKLAKLGGTAIISALVKMSGVLLVGFIVGTVIGLSTMNSLFLGVMLSISSTAIIQKSFEELGVQKENFSQMVMGSLIIEDIVAIFMMVILSTMSVSKNVEGGDLVISLALMLCYLVVWLILGIFFLPAFLNKVIKFMTDEMLLILSLGLCFGMVLIANKLGFSAELGAFLAGSLLAGTVHAEKVEHLSKGVKDMFSSIFFLSVGMMVNPQAIVDYAPIIILIVIVAIIAKLIFSSLGMILSGQTLETAVKSGFSLAPIGEFSFIIASLGITLGVMDEYLYPIIVSAAIITTFMTPSLIKNSDSVVRLLMKILPNSLVDKLNRYTSSDQTNDAKDSDWNNYIRVTFIRLALYGVIMLVTVEVGLQLLNPLLTEAWANDTMADVVTCLIIYPVMALFVRPMLNVHSTYFTALWLKRRANHLPLIAMTTLKIMIIALIAIIPLRVFFHWNPMVILLPVLLMTMVTAGSSIFSVPYLRMETRFLRNLNERILEKAQKDGQQQAWLDEELYIISLIAPEDANFLGISLQALQWGKRFNVYVVKLRHKGRQIILPGPNTMIQAGDKVFVVGELKAIENFYHLVKMKPTRQPRTLKEFMETDYPDSENALSICAVQVTGSEKYANRALKSGIMRDKYHCAVLGMQQEGYPIIMPDINTVIMKDDIIWVMGSNNNVGRLLAESASEEAVEEAIEDTAK
ncbi:MAG: cation:proton antiporter [Firmicutes bacterium]|nr:cation:proton antiporter [Bacillota bacterium]